MGTIQATKLLTILPTLIIIIVFHEKYFNSGLANISNKIVSCNSIHKIINENTKYFLMK